MEIQVDEWDLGFVDDRKASGIGILEDNGTLKESEGDSGIFYEKEEFLWYLLELMLIQKNQDFAEKS